MTLLALACAWALAAGPAARALAAPPPKAGDAGKKAAAPAEKAPASEEQPAPSEVKGQSPGEWAICMVDVKTPDILLQQGFRWMNDTKTVDQFSDATADYLACEARAKGVDACKALARLAPAFTYEKRIGDYQARCREMGRYEAFYREMRAAPKKSRKFPACADFLGMIGAPMKIFAVDAIAPRSLDPDPTNDGKFWNVCTALASGIQAGKSGFCKDPRLKYWLGSWVTPEFWDRICSSAAKMWLKGDPGLCAIIPKDDYCESEAALTRAMLAREPGLCPRASPDRGLCVAGAAKEPKKACGELWAKLRSDFCTQRARFKPEELPAKPKPTESKPR